MNSEADPDATHSCLELVDGGATPRIAAVQTELMAASAPVKHCPTMTAVTPLRLTIFSDGESSHSGTDRGRVVPARSSDHQWTSAGAQMMRWTTCAAPEMAAEIVTHRA